MGRMSREEMDPERQRIHTELAKVEQTKSEFTARNLTKEARDKGGEGVGERTLEEEGMHIESLVTNEIHKRTPEEVAQGWVDEFKQKKATESAEAKKMHADTVKDESLLESARTQLKRLFLKVEGMPSKDKNKVE